MVDGYQNSSTHQGNIVLLVNQAVPTLNTLAIYPAVEIEVPGNLGVSYQLQSSADLVIWDNVGAPMLGAGQPIRLLDFARGISKKFYRYLRVP